jgi:diguanylate cyclase (GGDEF)-like protein
VSADKCSLLVVDDEPYILPTLSAMLANDFEVHTADSAEAGQQVFAERDIHVVLTDQRMPRMTGVQFLEWVRARFPKTIRLLMTGYAELEDAVDAINRGQVYHYLLKPWRPEELQIILRNAGDKFRSERNREQLMDELQRANEKLHQLNAELEQRVHERTRALKEANGLLEKQTQELEAANALLQQRSRELETLALHDPLTDLLNRRAIDDAARSEIKRRARYRSPLALGLVDADHFKAINDRYLLTGGDEVLKALARILKNSLRTVDWLGRVGGEEFQVLAPETDMLGAAILAERIRSTVENAEILYEGSAIQITVSIGFAVANGEPIVDYDHMYHVAAAALNDAKRSGRNRCVIRPLN